MHPESMKDDSRLDKPGQQYTEPEEKPKLGDREQGKSKQTPKETASDVLQPKSRDKKEIEKVQPMEKPEDGKEEKSKPTDKKLDQDKQGTKPKAANDKTPRIDDKKMSKPKQNSGDETEGKPDQRPQQG